MGLEEVHPCLNFGCTFYTFYTNHTKEIALLRGYTYFQQILFSNYLVGQIPLSDLL